MFDRRLMPRSSPRYTLVPNRATQAPVMVQVRPRDGATSKSRAATAPSIGVARPSDVPVPPIKAMMKKKSTARPAGRSGKPRPKRPTRAPDRRRHGRS